MYKRQELLGVGEIDDRTAPDFVDSLIEHEDVRVAAPVHVCLLYTSDAADERSSVDLGGRRIIKKKMRYGCLLITADTTDEQCI